MSIASHMFSSGKPVVDKFYSTRLFEAVSERGPFLEKHRNAVTGALESIDGLFDCQRFLNPNPDAEEVNQYMKMWKLHFELHYDRLNEDSGFDRLAGKSLRYLARRHAHKSLMPEVVTYLFQQ